MRFDFAVPVKFSALAIWNHNQMGNAEAANPEPLADRCFRRTHIYGTSDGVHWTPLTSTPVITLPRTTGSPKELPFVVPNAQVTSAFKSVVIAADQVDGNYGAGFYGLSAVRFLVDPLTGVVPSSEVSVVASACDAPQPSPRHLVDGAGMFGVYHDNAHFGDTM